MDTFVSEQVKRLDAALNQSFEQKLEKNGIIKNFASLNERDQFLFKATQALDLTSNTPPAFEKVQEYLEKYHDTSSINATESMDTELESFFIAKCTIAVYGQVFSKVLNLTLPVSESIDYWNHIHGSTTREIYYGLQTAPYRIFNLLKSTTEQITQTGAVAQQVKSLFTSSDYILRQLFPIHNIKSSKQKQPFDALKFFTLSFHRRPLILEMLSDEINLKKNALQQFRAEQAASLGILLLSPPQFKYDQGNDFTSTIANETKNCIEMIKYLMEPSQTKKVKKNLHHFQTQLSMKNLNANSTQDISMELYQLTKEWASTYDCHLQLVQSSYGIPSRLTRYWIPSLISYFAASWTIQYGLERKEDIIHCLEELGKTAHDFVLNWIWEPVRKVYNTIRLKDQRLSLLSKEGLSSDLDSLERMVVGFAKDKLHIPDSEISRIAADVREGDISVLLKEYEKEIKNPLKNAITGDLLRTILIQVQKTKVDIDLAMAALDKLLKSNELNFAFLAVAPSMLLSWASISWFKNAVQGKSQQKIKKVGQPIRETLR
ncbi:ATP synthase regulation protein NCA2-domain-containing protein [Gilbertella persicaria]|uniref:ATP synthase regulation protein NCA2-domain-containing protein n=1 Tax=Gilbertella persicaria TaxID=101096 RepID=UPI00221F4C94|nr:ATP synthase regulation protein NCA2-domain-containing protein [Gilbertella persicaria]KAI8097874.1 ATP synthase regulation protein NCA2-domain-containing protein [Gilbertella persicaria]